MVAAWFRRLLALTAFLVASAWVPGDAVAEPDHLTLHQAALALPDTVLATVIGSVYDPARDEPVAGVRVFLAGTPHGATTDERGWFRIEAPLSGRHEVAVRHRELNALGVDAPRVAVVLEPGEVTEVALTLPVAPRAAALARECRDPARPGGVVAVSVAGVLHDRESGAPISAALVRFPALRRQAMTDGSGHFVVRDVVAGFHDLEVEHLAYGVRRERVEVTEEPEQFLQLRVPMEAIPLEAIHVVARSALRHDASWEGFLARREMLPPIGRRRAVRWDDPEMLASMTVGDVMKWLRARPRGCVVTLVDGWRKAGPGEDMSLSVAAIDGVEYYASVIEAPLDYAAQSQGCGVIVVWLRRRH